jgi:acetoin utilization deacetylase AcuC-like enzyme
MKPHRMKLTHHLIMGYGLYRKMECYRPHLASPDELARFHSEDYVDFLRRVTPENCKAMTTQMQKCARPPRGVVVAASGRGGSPRPRAPRRRSRDLCHRG